MLIKISLVVAAFYVIYQKLLKNSDLAFSDFVNFSSKNDLFLLKNMLFLLVLTIFNWFFEILKWQNLVSSIKKISFKLALKQCLGSLTASLFTPNRIGEYGAKAIYFSSTFRKHILLINLLGNLLQMAVTIVFGVIGLLVFVQTYSIQINTNKLAILVLAGLLLFIFIRFIFKKGNLNIKGFSIKKLKDFIYYFPQKKLVLGATYSLIRYLIFSFQFYYVLVLFKVDIGYLDAMTVITTMYLLASIIPSIFIFDVVIKGGIAVYLFSIIGVNELVSLSVVTIMWILNFVIPSIIGSFYVLYFKFPKVNE
nr:lysylphosphatidylglycerol synthase domain-containing protein [Yeosuana aromativorans]